MPRTYFLLTFCLVLVGSQLWAQPAVEAKRHFDAGMAAVQSARSETDYADAIKEFEQAACLLPTWPEVFQNLGLLEEAVGRYGEAAWSLKRYAKLAPHEVDSDLRKKISDLEYRAAKEGRVPPDINAFQDGMAQLGIAIGMNDLPAVELLLAKGASVDAPVSEAGVMPLEMALRDKNRVVIDLLLSRGANINWKDKTNDSLLHQFVYWGDREAIELLLDKGADLEARGHLGWTPLRQAIEKGDFEIAGLLRSRGANLEAEDDSGSTPLAATIGSYDVKRSKPTIRFLLEMGANPNVQHKSRTLISVAADKGLGDIVELLVSKGADPNLKNEDGTNALYRPVLYDEKEMVDLLLSVGVDLEARDRDDSTALHLAARRGKTSMVEFLLSKGAQLESKDGNGNTPLGLAQISNKHETAALLLARGASTKELNIEAKDQFGRTALHNASKDGDVSAVERLLNRGAEVNARDKFGLTPLHLAANVGSRKSRFVAELLVANGADLNAKGNLGHSPISLALEYLHLAMADYLHSAGADITDQERALFLPPDPNARGEQGKTWLYQAAADDEMEAAERLIKLGADVNAKTSLDTNPLAAAIWNKSEKMVDLLLAHGANPRCTVFEDPLLHMVEDSAVLDRLLKAGADIEARNGMGRTALHFAVSIGRKEQVELLVAKGAKLEANSPDGTPLHIAVSSGRTEMVALLLQLGATPQALDEKRRTPLDRARAQGFKEIEELLLNKGAK